MRTLLCVAADAKTPVELVDVVAARHASVQAGKLHRGQRKAPFVEQRDGAWTVCLSRIAENAREVVSAADVRPHAYRVRAAVRLDQPGSA